MDVSKMIDAIKSIRDGLSVQQEASLPSLMWIYHGERGSGRSQAIAAAAVIYAMEHPDTWVEIHDHSAIEHNTYAKMHIITLAIKVVAQIPDIDVRNHFVFNQSRPSIMYREKNTYER